MTARTPLQSAQRHMFGRAHLDLLRVKVLHAVEEAREYTHLALALFFSFISAWLHTIMEMRTAIWSKAMRDNQKMPGRRNFSLIAVVLVLFLSTACTPGSMAQKPSVPVASASIPGSPELNSLLRRPLHLPSLHTGNPCPTSPARRVFPAFGPAQGNGPAYEAATYDQAPSPAVLLYADAAHFGGGGSANQGWGGQKVLWFVDPRYQGYVLVRGHQIDGPHGMRFQTSLDPQLVINTADGGTPWPNMPSYTRLQAPGCYAYQVDGTTFSDEIIFQAMPSTYLLLRGVTCTRSRFLGYANG